MRLLSGQGSDEINVAGKSVSPRQARRFLRAAEVTLRFELLTVGGFYPAPISKAESLQDVGSAIHAMHPCPEKVAFAIALADLFEPGSD